MLYSTSLLAVVGAGEQAALSPRRVSILSAAEGVRALLFAAATSTVAASAALASSAAFACCRVIITAMLTFSSSPAQRVIADLYMQEAVTSIKLSRARLAVLTRAHAHVYTLATLQRLDSFPTALNPRGVCALSQSALRPLLAVPGSSTQGLIAVHVAGAGGGALCELHAHRTPLVALAFNADGSLLASASEKGTVIRIHSLPPPGSGAQAMQVHALRRGLSPSAIHSLWFATLGSRGHNALLVSSDGGTVHVFRSGDAPGGAHAGAEEQPHHSSYAGAAVAAAGALLQSLVPRRLRAPVADVVQAHRAVVTLRGLAQPGVRTVVALAPPPVEAMGADGGEPHVLVASYETGILGDHIITAPLDGTSPGAGRWGGSMSSASGTASGASDIAAPASRLVRETSLVAHEDAAAAGREQHPDARWLAASGSEGDTPEVAAQARPDLTASVNVSLSHSILL